MQNLRKEMTDSHFATRREVVDLDACVAQLNRFSKAEHIAPYLCGVCVSVCPWGRRKTKRRAAAQPV
jgi:epoxyqueuosine reductase QueG